MVAPLVQASPKKRVVMVEARDFKTEATQQIEFVPLRKINPTLFNNLNVPRQIDLRSNQTTVKSQGKRGACTYFTFTSLAESLIKRATGKDVDLSEEYIAWAAKTKLKIRVDEEDSSVFVNAATLQQFGFMLEKDLTYQPSWFDRGSPCENQKGKSAVDPVCYSHDGPKTEVADRIISGKHFLFEAIDSKSIDVVKALARLKNPVTISILGHRDMWEQTYKTGDLYLSKKWKKECQQRRGLCGGHAVLAVGYDLDKRVLFIKNTWGEKWGQKGYGTITFDYLDQMSDRKFLTGYLVGNVNLPKSE